MIVLGLDPSLRSFAFARFDLDIKTLALTPLSLELCSTETTKAKQVRKNSDDISRCRLIHEALARNLEGAQMVFAEVPVGSQSARAMMSYGACVMALAGINTPLVQVTPKEVKLAATGDANATKNAMIEWATGLYPGADWLRSRGRLIGDNEHLADATAAIHAGILTDQFKQARAILQWAA